MQKLRLFEWFLLLHLSPFIFHMMYFSSENHFSGFPSLQMQYKQTHCRAMTLQNMREDTTTGTAVGLLKSYSFQMSDNSLTEAE